MDSRCCENCGNKRCRDSVFAIHYNECIESKYTKHWMPQESMREPMVHELKILPEYYKRVISRHKTFELRKDDRDFRVGDRLFLREWDGEKYTGHQTQNRIITYILRDAKEYGLEDGYCILGIQPVDWDWLKQTTVIQNGNNCTNITNVGTLNM